MSFRFSARNVVLLPDAFRDLGNWELFKAPAHVSADHRPVIAWQGSSPRLFQKLPQVVQGGIPRSLGANWRRPLPFRPG